MSRGLALLLVLAAGIAPAAGRDAIWAEVPGGGFSSVLALGQPGVESRVEAFALMRRPVSNAQFLEFVRTHPDWQRGATPEVFADGQYLSHWTQPLDLGEIGRAHV